jgi:hypothetical protein
MATNMRGAAMQMATDQDEKVRENRLRRIAERAGLRLEKSRRRDPRAIDYDCWQLVGSDSRVTERPMMSLDAVEAFLESPLVVELRRAGRAYVESHGGNRDELQQLVREGMQMGMPAEPVAFLTGLAPEDVAAMSRGGA